MKNEQQARLEQDQAAIEMDQAANGKLPILCSEEELVFDLLGGVSNKEWQE